MTTNTRIQQILKKISLPGGSLLAVLLFHPLRAGEWVELAPKPFYGETFNLDKGRRTEAASLRQAEPEINRTEDAAFYSGFGAQVFRLARGGESRGNPGATNGVLRFERSDNLDATLLLPLPGAADAIRISLDVLLPPGNPGPDGNTNTHGVIFAALKEDNFFSTRTNLRIGFWQRPGGPVWRIRAQWGLPGGKDRSDRVFDLPEDFDSSRWNRLTADMDRKRNTVIVWVNGKQIAPAFSVGELSACHFAGIESATGESKQGKKLVGFDNLWIGPTPAPAGK
ncbi:MAG: hypothetical protein LBK99_01045 [Opitutaceae bacterium]|jgi:hypothetical protein|nr:hypothetical protein [Opitutaceae bacterium]